MARAASLVTTKAGALFGGQAGMTAGVSVVADVAGVQVPPFTRNQVTAQNVTPEIVERSTAAKYPGLYIYCSKSANLQREKFRTFSGNVEMTLEVRVSQDRLEGIENSTMLYVDGATWVLDQNRGDWGDGVFYGGGYEISYAPVKQGGKNFLQIAKISFTTEVSTD